MSLLDLSGSFQYAPGLWGAAVPASGVNVEIVETHVDRTQSTIWSGTTDVSGRFSGTSSEWRRTIQVTVGVGPVSASAGSLDPGDVLALTCRVKRGENGPNAREGTFPFVWLGNQLPSPPIVLPWGPPDARKGRVNGSDCWSLPELLRRARLAAGQPFTMDIYFYGPDAEAHVSLLRSIVRDFQRFIADQRARAASSQKHAVAGIPAAGAKMQQGVRDVQRRVSATLTPETVGVIVGVAAIDTFVVIAMVFIVVAVLTPGVATVAVAVSAALVALIVTLEVASLGGAVLANLPTILRGLAVILDSMGANAGAQEIRRMATRWSQSMAWAEPALVLCMTMLCLIVSTLGAILSFGVEALTGPEGQRGVRLQATR